ncbi:MAG: hypothetical protein AAB575_04425 [Patescibacteria group bacterium]
MKKFLMRLVAPYLPDDIGSVHIQWEFPEFTSIKRSRAWNAAAFIVLAFLVVYAVWTANFLFAMILALCTFILVYQYFQKPRPIPVVVAEDGVIVDKQFYPYKVLKDFYIIYEPPYSKYLYLEFKNKLRNNLPIPLEDMNPIQVRETLLNYLDENLEKDEESGGEAFGRLLNIR